jgi:hypothetical protein
MDQRSASRVKLSEVSAKRVVAAAGRRLGAIPERVSWASSNLRSAHLERLEALRDRHIGETVVIIANGPSLAAVDMTQLRSVSTISMNRAYLSWDEWGFTPSYFVSINGLVLQQFASDIVALPCQKFINTRSRRFYDTGASDLILLNTGASLTDRFDVTGRKFSTGGTVTFVALQLAYLLGFHKAVLIGLDHRFASSTAPNQSETRDASPDRDHFRPDYFPPGVQWQGPDLVRSEYSYEVARQAYEAAGREIVDATEGGACRVFERTSLTRALDL